jgi:hypothetical protein
MGVRVDEHASRPLRADVAQALLGSGGPGDGGEVLGHSSPKSTPRTGLKDVGRDVPIPRPIVDGESHRPTARRNNRGFSIDRSAASQATKGVF